MAIYNRFYLIIITVFAATGGLLFGFDMAVISGVLPFVQLQFELSAGQEGWFVASALIGCVLGVAFSGELSDRGGRRNALLLSASLFLISAIGCAVAPDFTLLIIARMLGGMAVGIASNVVPLYISEIAPAEVRGRLVTCYQLAITIGILAAYISNAILLRLSGTLEGTELGPFLEYIMVQEVWRIMFGIEAIPALVFLTGLLFIPESPRWLYNRGRDSEGLAVLRRIGGDARAEVNAVEIKNALEETEGSYRDLLRPGMRIALLIGLLLPVFSQFSGINAIIYYGPRILGEAGVPIDSALASQVMLGFANMVFTFIAVWQVDRLGRRLLYLIGTAGATLSLMATGFFFYVGETGSVFLLISVIAFLACFAFSIGPLKFVVASEIFPNKIRGRALALSIMAMWVSDAVVGQLTPVLLSTGGAAMTFWFFAFFCAIAFWFIYKKVPETKGKSLEEIQHMWARKPAS